MSVNTNSAYSKEAAGSKKLSEIPSPDAELKIESSKNYAVTPSKPLGADLLTPSSSVRFSGTGGGARNNDGPEIGEIPTLGMRDWVLSTPRRKENATPGSSGGSGGATAGPGTGAIASSGAPRINTGPASSNKAAGGHGLNSADVSHSAVCNPSNAFGDHSDIYGGAVPVSAHPATGPNNHAAGLPFPTRNRSQSFSYEPSSLGLNGAFVGNPAIGYDFGGAAWNGQQAFATTVDTQGFVPIDHGAPLFYDTTNNTIVSLSSNAPTIRNPATPGMNVAGRPMQVSASQQTQVSPTMCAFGINPYEIASINPLVDISQPFGGVSGSPDAGQFAASLHGVPSIPRRNTVAPGNINALFNNFVPMRHSRRHSIDFQGNVVGPMNNNMGGVTTNNMAHMGSHLGNMNPGVMDMNDPNSLIQSYNAMNINGNQNNSSNNMISNEALNRNAVFGQANGMSNAAFYANMANPDLSATVGNGMMPGQNISSKNNTGATFLPSGDAGLGASSNTVTSSRDAQSSFAKNASAKTFDNNSHNSSANVSKNYSADVPVSGSNISSANSSTGSTGRFSNLSSNSVSKPRVFRTGPSTPTSQGPTANGSSSKSGSFGFGSGMSNSSSFNSNRSFTTIPEVPSTPRNDNSPSLRRLSNQSANENNNDRENPLKTVGKGMPLSALPLDSKLWVVEFKSGRSDIYYSIKNNNTEFKIRDLVIVEADRGKDLGKITSEITRRQIEYLQEKNDPAIEQIHMENREPSPRIIYRRALPDEVRHLPIKSEDEKRSLDFCCARVEAHGLPMTIMDAEYQFDRRKLTFYFESQERIDFRALIQELFKVYKTRIWMCSVSARATAGDSGADINAETGNAASSAAASSSGSANSDSKAAAALQKSNDASARSRENSVGNSKAY